MKKIIVEGGGFPGTSKTWRFIAEMIDQNSELINNIAGDNVIVSGLQADGATAVTDGLVVIGGEFYPVQGGAVALENAYVSITEDIEQTQYLKDDNGDGAGDLIDTYFERYALVTDQSTGNVKLTDLERLLTIRELSRRIPPKKCPIPFWGYESELGPGWQFVDGTNGTPDLRGQFIVGLDPNDPDYDEIGKTGGSKKHTLTESELAQHSHGGNTGSAGHHNHSYKDSFYIENLQTPDFSNEYIGVNKLGSGDADNDNSYIWYRNGNTGNTGSHTHSITTNSKGGGQAHENRPPFYALAYIAYTGV